MAAKISGLRKSHEAASDFVTVTKSAPKKTRVTPVEPPISFVNIHGYILHKEGVVFIIWEGGGGGSIDSYVNEWLVINKLHNQLKHWGGPKTKKNMAVEKQV